MSFRNNDESNTDVNKSGSHLEHYTQLFMRKAHVIVPVTIGVIIVWFVAISISGFSKPMLESTAILQFDDPKNISAIEQQAQLLPNTKAVLIKSRSFLEDVARKLALQVQVVKHSRSQIFDSIAVSLEAPTGSYEVKIEGDSYKVMYSDLSGTTKNKVVSSGPKLSVKEYRVPGLYLKFSSDYSENPYNLNFRVTRLRDAVDFIADNMTIKMLGKDESIMSVSIAGRDYEMITQIVNSIADNFVNANSTTNLDRQSGVLKVLEKQLETARKEMLSSEATLKQFRAVNPTVGLKDAFSPPVKIMDLKESEAELRAARLEGISLKNRFFSSADTSRLELIGELVSYLSKYQASTAPAFQSELDLLADNDRKFKEEYSPMHPVVLKNKSDIRTLGTKVAAALNELLRQLDRRIRENNNRIDQINSQIAGLPSKEIELANLQRRYDVNSEIYSNVLTRYNEARIAKAVAIGDVYIVDYGVMPEQNFDLKSLITLVGIGLFLGFTIGFGPVVTYDFFDRTAKSEKDFKRMTNLTLLESIPVKGSWSVSPDSSQAEKLVNPKLVTADYSQNFVDEMYRSLRAKILLSLHENKSKRLLVTSLNMGEGKSFTSANLAITMAQQRISTLLIDGDLRRGNLHKCFAVEKKPGLSDLLHEKNQTGTLLQSALQKTHIPDLTLLASGNPIPGSPELLNSTHFRQLMYNLSKQYEMIILDTPPIAVVTDAVGIQDAFQKYLIVVRASHTNLHELNKKISEYPGLQRKILGVVFNGAPYKRSEYYQYTNYKY